MSLNRYAVLSSYFFTLKRQTESPHFWFPSGSRTYIAGWQYESLKAVGNGADGLKPAGARGLRWSRWTEEMPPFRRLRELAPERHAIHGGQPVLRWMMDNIFVQQDQTGNIRLDKDKATEKTAGAVAVMASVRAVRNDGSTGSVYDERENFVLLMSADLWYTG